MSLIENMVRRIQQQDTAAQRARWAVALLWSCEPTDRALAGWDPLGTWSRKSFARELGLGPDGVVTPQLGTDERPDRSTSRNYRE